MLLQMVAGEKADNQKGIRTWRLDSILPDVEFKFDLHKQLSHDVDLISRYWLEFPHLEDCFHRFVDRVEFQLGNSFISITGQQLAMHSPHNERMNLVPLPFPIWYRRASQYIFVRIQVFLKMYLFPMDCLSQYLPQVLHPSIRDFVPCLESLPLKLHVNCSALTNKERLNNKLQYPIHDFCVIDYFKLSMEKLSDVLINNYRPIYQIAVVFDVPDCPFEYMQVQANYNDLLKNNSCQYWKYLDKIAFKNLEPKWNPNVYTCTFQRPRLFVNKFQPEDSLLHAENIDCLKLKIQWKPEHVFQNIHVAVSIICENHLLYDCGIMILRKISQR